ncbi:hypothetical protein [Hyphococcus sp.]|uniref:hypothetical protein n=1 Tax=Hyphococcus sp. TaxID=2038636 RepID=UPI003D0FAA7E
MQNIILISAGAGLAGLLLGWLAANLMARRKYRAQAEEVRGEVVRLRAIAEEKLSGDVPDLDELIGNFQTAATSAYDAIQAMETQVKITKAKSEGSRQVIASSAQIIRMIEDQAGLDGAAVAIKPVSEKAKAPRLTARKKA